ncbi:uncharacterized protein LOC113863658 [Abrus precatorius]|uniref:Uncharacterized protein LOC113863658 n=1 Tax=Abrus precatorius TaxID=3816 RepID=A0A8B8LA57_ABRPR|nr:uncharacterized protein LOC113863658 [Abrus precatorius]
MEKNTTSRSSICWKIRQAFATSPVFRAIHRIKHYYQEPKHVITHSNSPSLPPSIHLPQNMKANNQGGAIPIMFDYSIPTSTSMVHGQVSKVASPQAGISEKTGKVGAKVEAELWNVQGYRAGVFKGEHIVKDTICPLKEQQTLRKLHSQQEGKKTLDINDTFTEYIQRAKYRIRTVSNVGHGKNNSVPDETNGSNGNNNRMENQKDQFSDFIQRAKKKIRTTSNIGRTSSLKRG